MTKRNRKTKTRTIDASEAFMDALENTVLAEMEAAAVSPDQMEPTPAETPAEAEAQAEEHEEPKATRSVVPMSWRKEYARRPLKNTCSDDLAYRLAELTKGDDGKPNRAYIVEVTARNGIDAEARWGMRNIGMMRMNLGNVLRGKAKRGEIVDLTRG